MTRYIKILLAAFLALLLGLIAALVVISTISWEYAKPWINERATTLAERPAAVNGDLTLRWVKPPYQQGWRRWIPWPEISAHDIVLGSPWENAENTAAIKNLKIIVNPWALIDHKVQAPEVVIQDAAISLEKRQDGSNNWTFGDKRGAAPPSWTFELRDLSLKNVSLRYIDATRKLELAATFNSLRPSGTAHSQPAQAHSAPAGVDSDNGPASPGSGQYDINWTVEGSVEGEAVKGKGRMGTLLSLQAGAAPMRVDGNVQIGSTTIGVTGALPKLDFTGPLDVQLRLAGDVIFRRR